MRVVVTLPKRLLQSTQGVRTVRNLIFPLVLLLSGCSTVSQNLDTPVSNRADRLGVQPQEKVKFDDLLLAKAESCPGRESFPKGKADDDYDKVQARWKLLDCLFKHVQGRRLVVLLDGTANDKEDSTNIWRLYELALSRTLKGSLDTKIELGDPVIPYYDKGVGTSPTSPISGAAFGTGVSMNIRQAYRFLVEAYKPEDQIFLFGFSRGAFTARSLNGFIEFAGLAKPATVASNTLDDTFLLWWAGNFHSKVSNMYKIYHRSNTGSATFESDLRGDLKKYRQENNIEVYGDKPSDRKVTVEVVGVFDTVPAVGLGLDEDPDGHRIELYARRGYHAMSLDEQRDSFRLQRFGVPQYEQQTLEEVWFAGAHADIGGGYYKGPEALICGKEFGEGESAPVGLEATPLRWMLTRTRNDRIFSDAEWPRECVGGQLHDEYFDANRFLAALYKNAGLLRRKPIAHDNVDKSVLTRMKIGKLAAPHPDREPKGQYRPVNLGHDPESTFTIVSPDSMPALTHSP